MPNVADFYPLWLRATDLPPDKVVPVTIERVTAEELHPKPGMTERKLVLAFKGKSRRMVLNSGNARRLVDLAGEDYSGWAGLVVGLRRVKFTKDVDTIHVVAAPPTNGGGK